MSAIDYNLKEFEECSKQIIQEMLDKYYDNPSQLMPHERYVCEATIRYYPNDPKKQVDLIHVMNMAILFSELQGLPHGTVKKELLMNLAIDNDVQEAFITEFLYLKK